MTAEDVYKRLLTAIPAGFRREYGDGMIEAFRDLRQQTARGQLGFWFFVIADTLRASSAERALACRARARPPTAAPHVVVRDVGLLRGARR
jgi:hypothetical protein